MLERRARHVHLTAEATVSCAYLWGANSPVGTALVDLGSSVSAPARILACATLGLPMFRFPLCIVGGQVHVSGTGMAACWLLVSEERMGYPRILPTKVTAQTTIDCTHVWGVVAVTGGGNPKLDNGESVDADNINVLAAGQVWMPGVGIPVSSGKLTVSGATEAYVYTSGEGQ